MSHALSLYVLADYLLGARSSPHGPMRPAALPGGLRQLRERCRGSLDRLRLQVEGAPDEADSIDWDSRTA